MELPAITATTLAALLSGVPAVAVDFTPPAGCESFLTVQNKSCSVSLLWRCDVAPEGDFWEATFGPEGLEMIVSYTGDYQWLDSVFMWDSSREEFVPPAADPIEASGLLTTGVDSYDFIMHRSEPGRSYDLRVIGADQLTGETVTIDGYEMDVVATRIELTAEDGTVEYSARGEQLYSRTLGHFFLGIEEALDADGSTTRYDDTPIDIILPGEPGFGATTPLYECDQLKAGFTPDAPIPAQKETIHDEV